MAGFDAGRVIQAYGAGVQDRQQRERTSALSAYGGAAARGDQNAIDALSAAAPDLGIRFAEHAAGMQEAERKRSLETWDWVGSALLKQDGTPITDQADLDRVKTLAKARGIDPKLVDGVSLENVPNLIQFSQTARNYQRQASQDQLQRRVAEANINQSNAAAAASRASAERATAGGKAPQGYVWSPDGSSLVAVPGGPADPTRKLTEGQSKDLGFFNRGVKANEEMTPDRLGAQTGFFNTVGRSVGGNVLQSNLSRQGMQASRNFIASILRKDTGAAVTPQEFDFYSDIFIPSYGDDDQTVRLKADARTEALNAIRQGLGAAQVLALPAVQAAKGGGAAAGGDLLNQADSIVGLGR